LLVETVTSDNAIASNLALNKFTPVHLPSMSKNFGIWCVLLVLIWTSACQRASKVGAEQNSSHALAQVEADGQLNAAIKRLTNVSTFAFGGVGFLGVQSEGETDFKVVMSRPRFVALTAFEKLYVGGNTQGKGYALAGIKRLNNARFKELLAMARQSSDKVAVMRGCVMSQEPLGGVAQQIADGKFQSKFE
jgi:hypothetical protein